MARRPGDKVGAKKKTKPRSGLACIRAAHPISVRVGNEIHRGRLVKFHPIVRGAFDVPQDALNQLIMSVPG
jgi:hypothetical protein